jgi:hypothetical protein
MRLYLTSWNDWYAKDESPNSVQRLKRCGFKVKSNFLYTYESYTVSTTLPVSIP